MPPEPQPIRIDISDIELNPEEQLYQITNRREKDRVYFSLRDILGKRRVRVVEIPTIFLTTR
jgi:hypothetical protein